MSTAVLLVRTRPPAPEVEEKYNDWYDRVHIPQILAAVPAITGAQRFLLLSSQGRPDAPAAYLAIYEIDSVDPQDALGHLAEAMAAGEITMDASVEVLGSALYAETPGQPQAESS
jgi:hypothetical protein